MSPNIWHWDQAADQEAGDNVSNEEPGHQHKFNIDSVLQAAAPPCPHVMVRVISSDSNAHGGASCNTLRNIPPRVARPQTAALCGFAMFHKWRGMSYKLDCF